MNDETPHRPPQTDDRRGHPPGGSGEPAPIQTRACFLENRSWAFVTDLNRRLCERGGAQHGTNPESHEATAREWERLRPVEQSLLETFDFLRQCHRRAPFLFLNGNTFGEIGRTLTDFLFADVPVIKRKHITSAAAHYVAGVLDQASLIQIMESLSRECTFKPGDRVQTLKGSLKGTIVEILPDGHIVWNDGHGNMTSSADSLLPV